MQHPKTNCLIVEDEPLAAQLLEKHISNFSYLNLVSICTNAISAFEVLNTEKIDLIFLDIQMPVLDGVKFAKSLKNPPSIIFTTAYRNYAVESYELEVVDYLLKPITIERFLKSMDKYFSKNNTISVPKYLPKQVSQEDEKTYFFINVNKKHIKVNFEEIEYIESLKDYVGIYVKAKRHVTKLKISDLETSLPSYFLRIHRSYIVNKNHITAFTMQDIEIGKMEIPIGDSYKERVVNAL
ncbi:response regulator transcription factor [Bernardetia sp. ABR2-2B]|uniref:LytR/AlgR family response regulator transcription factor n=1 Tax=Bernardetia sp. ABR2-2B TaxID=3127472 RepID=UPI0030D48243